MKRRVLLGLVAASSAAVLMGGCEGDEGGTGSLDLSPPAAVTNLTVVDTLATDSSLTLTWTASGDDGDQGTADRYDLRRAASPILTLSDWDSAAQVAAPPAPQPAGATELFVADSLAPATTYHFALRVADEAGHWSALSNPDSGTTLAHTATRIVAADGSGDYATIQAAIDDATSGDRIEVRAGTYREALVVSGKTLAIAGAGADSCWIEHDVDQFPGERALTVRGGATLALSGVRVRQLLTLCSNGIVVQQADAQLEDCALIECGFTAEDASVTLTGCTIYRNCNYLCESVIPLVDLVDATATLERCIVTAGSWAGVQCDPSSAAALGVRCCDCWNNGASGHNNYVGCTDPTGSEGNISALPSFLDPSGGDFRLVPGSPCLADCGQMGAFGAGF